MNKTITPLKADLMLALVSFLWGSSYVVTKNFINTIGPFYNVFYRFAIASILCLIFYRKHLRKISKGEIKAGILTGAILGIGILFSLAGIKYTTVSKNSFIVSIYVVFVPFVYWAICKKKPTNMSIFAVFLMMVGLAFLTLDFNSGFSINIGDILSFGCVIFYALQVIFNDIYAKKYNPICVNTVIMITCSVISFIGIIFEGNINFKISGESLIYIMYLGVFTTFICYSIQIVAQKYTVATHAAIIMSLESVTATALAVIFLKEKLSINMIIGCIVIFISVLISEIGDSVLAKIIEKYYLRNKNAIELQDK
ncbi:MAG: DMT family transporter [Tissierellia bacterium]|nr:DMT family transporter [Tissierellia bacterium]MDD4779651.1 DMT family transporter [Tissierellia bacterium]